MQIAVATGEIDVVINHRQATDEAVNVAGFYKRQSAMADDLVVRTLGLARARVKIVLRNLSYNMNRLKGLLRPPKRSVARG